MGKPSAPPPPDYAALAAQQGQQNLQTAQYNNAANRVNQTGPYGSVSYSQAPGANPNNPQPGDWTQTTTLDPTQQQMLDKTNDIGLSFLNTANSSLGRVGDALSTPFSTAGLPGLSYGPSGVPALGAPSPVPGIPSLGNIPGVPQTPGLGAQPQAQTSLNTSGVPALNTDYSKQAAQVTQALLDRQTPMLDQQDEASRTRLLNSGVTNGSTAWSNNERQLGQNRNDAQQQAILGGDQEAQTLAQQALQQQGQAYGQALSTGNFGNSAVGQNFGQALSAQGQNYAQALGAQGQQYAQAVDLQGQQYSQAMGAQQQGYQQGLQTQGQQYGQALQNSQFSNQAQQQAIAQQAYLRELPINETNALRTGSNVQLPSYGGYYTNGAQPAPTFDAGVAQGNYNTAAYQQQTQGYDALLGGLSKLGGAAIGAWSDSRLKKNIRTIGLHPAGVRRIAWDWVDDSGSDTGVLAEELAAVRPDAVGTRDGFLTVDYSLIGGR